MNLRALRPIRRGMCRRAAPTYEREAAARRPGRVHGEHDQTQRGSDVVTAVARPHVAWIGEDPASVRGWPVGAALLETLGSINSDVGEALADERARLAHH